MKRYNSEEYFTRTPSIFTIIQESVYRPDNYVKNLLQYLKEILKKYEGKTVRYPGFICNILNKEFSKYNIIFEYEGGYKQDGYKCGINEMRTGSTSLTIIIQCSPSIEKIFIDKNFQIKFIQAFKELIGHELIHRGQFIAVQNFHMDKIIARFLHTDKYKTEIGYYANKHEIMSWSWQIIEELRFKGATDAEILYYLKNKKGSYDSPVFENIYLKFYNSSNVLKRLLKYMYEYLKGNFDLNQIKGAIIER